MGMRALFASCNHFARVELNAIKEASQGIHVVDSISRHLLDVPLQYCLSDMSIAHCVPSPQSVDHSVELWNAKSQHQFWQHTCFAWFLRCLQFHQTCLNSEIAIPTNSVQKTINLNKLYKQIKQKKAMFIKGFFCYRKITIISLFCTALFCIHCKSYR